MRREEKHNEVFFGFCLSLSMIAATLSGLFIFKTTEATVLAISAAILAALWSATALFCLDLQFQRK